MPTWNLSNQWVVLSKQYFTSLLARSPPSLHLSVAHTNVDGRTGRESPTMLLI